MTSELRLAVVLFGSLLLWSPALTAFLAGDLAAGTVGVRYAASLVLTCLAVTGLDAVTRGYRSAPAAEGDRPAVDGPARRTDDASMPRSDGAQEEATAEVDGDE